MASSTSFSVQRTVQWKMALFKQGCLRVFGMQQRLLAASSQSASQICNVSDLKSVLAEKIPAVQEEVKAFRKQHGNTKIGEITVDSLYGGNISFPTDIK